MKMNPVDPEKITLDSTCAVSLHERFTCLMKHQTEEQKETSLKNKRLAMEMATRPSVLAALDDRSNINNQLCKVNVKSRLGHTMGSGWMMGLQEQVRGEVGDGRGIIKGLYSRKCINRLQGVTTRLGVQRDRNHHQHGNQVNLGGPMGAQEGEAVGKSGPGNFRPIRRAYPAFGRSRGNNRQLPTTRAELDEQLNDYMSMSKRHLDAELDAYMAQVDLKDLMCDSFN